MPYAKRTWTDRVVERPLTYTEQVNADGTITLIPAEGSIIAAGTPITADNLNNMENGIAAAVERAGDTMTGDLTAPNLRASTAFYEAGAKLEDKYSLKPLTFPYTNMQLWNGWTAGAGLTPQFCDLKNGYMHLVGTFIPGTATSGVIVVHLPIEFSFRKVMRIPAQYSTSCGHFLLQDEAQGYPTLYWGGQAVGTNPVTINAIVPIGYS